MTEIARQKNHPLVFALHNHEVVLNDIANSFKDFYDAMMDLYGQLKVAGMVDQAMKRKTQMVNRIFIVFIAGFLVLLYLFQEYHYYILPVMLITLTPISGYIALLNIRAKSTEKKQVNWMAASPLSIHPYVSFVIFVVVDLLYIISLL